MATETAVAEVVKPSMEAVRAATLGAFKGKLPDDVIHNFLDATAASPAAKDDAVITATGSMYFAVIWGVISCKPTHYPYYFEEQAWGLGIGPFSCGGELHNAFKGHDWDAFFEQTAGYHAQGIAKAGGLLQITFFNKSAVPIGQFNAVAGGIGVFECGGKGKWHKK